MELVFSWIIVSLLGLATVLQRVTCDFADENTSSSSIKFVDIETKTNLHKRHVTKSIQVHTYLIFTFILCYEFKRALICNACFLFAYN